MKLNNKKSHRTRGKHSKHKKPGKHKKTRVAGAPKGPYNRKGHLNRFWVREYGNAHASIVVDPDETGSYCHVTLEYNDDPTKYHYGFEVNNPRHRAMGKHFWTTPYQDEDKFNNHIRGYLEELYDELCNDDTIDRAPSMSLMSRSKRSRSRSRSRGRSRRSRSRSRSRARSRR
jgi:hypothetical protein